MPERSTAGHREEAQIDPRYCPIFVFGSAMNSSSTRASCPGAKFLSTAYLADYELCFPRWHEDERTFIVGYQTAAGKFLWGVVWLIPRNEISSLDDAKGCKPGQLGHHYDRVPISVCFSEGTVATVETYRAVPGQSGQPSRAHLDFIITGAEEHKLPREYIDMLRRTITLETLSPDFRAVA